MGGGKETSIMRSNIKSVNPVAESELSTARPSIESPIDPQVKPKRPYAPRRSFSPAYKQKILAAYDACQDASERGALLRREGLYYARVAEWRRQRNQGNLESGQNHGKPKNKVRVDHLARENEQLKKKLAHAEAIIDLQKKVSELLGAHVLPHESSEESL
jgi:transposase